MMGKHKRHIIHLTTYLLYALTLLGLTMIVLYLWPRNIVTLTQFNTTAKEYKTGDTIYVDVITQKHVEAKTTSDVYLECGAGNGQMEYYLKTISMNSDRDGEKIHAIFPVASVPYSVFPSDCKLVATNTYEVKFFLGFTRDYRETFTSNSFSVISK